MKSISSPTARITKTIFSSFILLKLDGYLANPYQTNDSTTVMDETSNRTRTEISAPATESSIATDISTATTGTSIGPAQESDGVVEIVVPLVFLVIAVACAFTLVTLYRKRMFCFSRIVSGLNCEPTPACWQRTSYHSGEGNHTSSHAHKREAEAHTETVISDDIKPVISPRLRKEPFKEHKEHEKHEEHEEPPYFDMSPKSGAYMNHQDVSNLLQLGDEMYNNLEQQKRQYMVEEVQYGNYN